MERQVVFFNYTAGYEYEEQSDSLSEKKTNHYLKQSAKAHVQIEVIKSDWPIQ